LDLTETRQEEAQREGTSETADVKIFKFALWLKRNGKAENTIKMRTTMLRVIVQQGACLTDPESVKEAIALRECSNTTKRFIVESYKSFAEFAGIQWKPPKYKGNETIPFIPLEREIDDLIACCSKKTSALLQLLKESGARLGEALEVAWVDLDSEQRVVRIQKPEKGSNPRALRISDKLLSMLNSLPKESPKIFGGRALAPNYQESFNRFRKMAAFKLQNPRLLQIHFHTLRHWKGTMEYHKTKDPWHVKKILGHKSLRSTEIYINVEQALFLIENDEFNVKVAEKTDEIKALLEVGFEYVCQKDSLMFFRKRK
jgi:integrase